MFEKLTACLDRAQCVGIFAHENPDGDAMGSAYSLKLALLQKGKRAEVFLTQNPDTAALAMVRRGASTEIKVEDCDLLVAVDCAEIARLGEYAAVFSVHPNTAAVDHHVTHCPFAKETVVLDVSSCCEIMVQLYEAWPIKIEVDMANNLYLGMVTDTGNFKYSSVTAQTLRRAADLVECGADLSGIAKWIFDTKSMEYYRLLRVALDRFKLYEDGTVCVLYLSTEDFAKAEITEMEASPIVALPGTVRGVQVGAYIRRREDETYKVSLRSYQEIDVAAIAKRLGGGGHVRAAGYSVCGQTIEEMTETLLAEIRKQKKEAEA